MKNVNEIPVLLLTGYLGSGKTTLVNRILRNTDGIRFAVIVNDIGEVNIDASLIAKGGVVDMSDDSLVSLQNGCICCTLQTDLIQQLDEIASTRKFDYILIEASGICEPEPIAQSICSMPQLGPVSTSGIYPHLDCVVTVVDALRLRDEFCSGEDLNRDLVSEENLANLVIRQIEFCDKILLNKSAEVEVGDLKKIMRIIRELNHKAEIVNCNYADVPMDILLHTGLFSYSETEGGAGWIAGLESEVKDNHHSEDHDEYGHHHHGEHGDHHHDCDCPEGHCHCGHHHHGEGEAEEYGICTFVYFRREPFDISKFDWFVAKRLPSNVIRAKGLCYFTDDRDMSFLFDQAGRQVSLSQAGRWYATAPAEELAEMSLRDSTIMKDWDPVYGDRMQKIVFIGQNMDKQQIIRDLDCCLTK